MTDAKDPAELESQSFFWDRYMTSGKTAFEREDQIDAVRMFMLALKAAVVVEDKVRTAQSMSWMALVQYELSNFTESERLVKQVIGMSDDLKGTELVEERRNYELLAMICRRQHKYKEARDAYEWLVEDCQRRGVSQTNQDYLALLDMLDDTKRQLAHFNSPQTAAFWDFTTVN